MQTEARNPSAGPSAVFEETHVFHNAVKISDVLSNAVRGNLPTTPDIYDIARETPSLAAIPPDVLAQIKKHAAPDAIYSVVQVDHLDGIIPGGNYAASQSVAAIDPRRK